MQYKLFGLRLVGFAEIKAKPGERWQRSPDSEI